MSPAKIIKLDREIPAADFRGAMRHLVGAVSVITVGRGDDVTGMTVTSVSSLAVDPPSLIVSVNRSASSWPLLKQYGFFGVNILSAEQRDIAERFAGKGGLKGADRFAGAEWTARASGAPLLMQMITLMAAQRDDALTTNEALSRACLDGFHAVSAGESVVASAPCRCLSPSRVAADPPPRPSPGTIGRS